MKQETIPVIFEKSEITSRPHETLEWLLGQELSAAQAIDENPTAAAAHVRLGLVQQGLGGPMEVYEAPLREGFIASGNEINPVHDAIRDYATDAVNAGHTSVASQALQRCERHHSKEPLGAQAHTAHIAGRIAAAEGNDARAMRLFGQAQTGWEIHTATTGEPIDPTLLLHNANYARSAQAALERAAAAGTTALTGTVAA
jgi:hypothetical protein